MLQLLFNLTSFLLIFTDLLHNQAIDQRRLPGVNVMQGYPINSVMNWHHMSMLETIILALCHYISGPELFAVMAKAVVYLLT